MLSLHQVKYRPKQFNVVLPGMVQEAFQLSIPELKIPNQGVTAIVGKNGSGKSTLLSLMAGLIAPDQGSCTFEGRSCFQVYDRVKQDVKILSWSTEFDARLKSSNYLELLCDLTPNWDHHLEARLVQEFTIPLEQQIQTLSRGELAKLKLLLAVCQHPKVLLIDELTNDLDHSSRKAIFNLIDERVYEQSISVIWATNILSDVERYANNISVMNHGTLVAHESLEQFRSRHQKISLHNQGESIKPRLEGFEKYNLEWDGTNGLLICNQFNDRVKAKLTEQNISFNLLPYSLNEILAYYGAQ